MDSQKPYSGTLINLKTLSLAKGFLRQRGIFIGSSVSQSRYVLVWQVQQVVIHCKTAKLQVILLDHSTFNHLQKCHQIQLYYYYTQTSLIQKAKKNIPTHAFLLTHTYSRIPTHAFLLTHTYSPIPTHPFLLTHSYSRIPQYSGFIYSSVLILHVSKSGICSI